MNHQLSRSARLKCILIKTPSNRGNLTQDGAPFVQGRPVTGFSNPEEAAVELTEVVPFLLEDELKANGGEYQKAEDWNPFAITDGKLITGQNPASSEMVAKAVMETLAK